MDLQDRVKSAIENNRYLTLATSSKTAKPWVSPLYFAIGEDYTIYWYSQKAALHSINISENPSVAITIFNSTVKASEVDALYMEATAVEVTAEEINSALIVYNQKEESLDTERDSQDFLGESPLRMYKAVPQKMWLYDGSKRYKGKYLDTRIEVSF